MASFPIPDLNPCKCDRCYCEPPNPCPADCLDCCLKACSAIIACDDAVGPCGLTGQFDLTTLDHITTGCTGTVRYVLEAEDGFFPYVDITEAGILTWVTPGPEFVNEFGEICFRLACPTDCDDCIGDLESVGKVTIGVKDLCQGSTCGQSEVCDPCTGDCVTVSVDTEIQSVDYTTDTEISS